MRVIVAEDSVLFRDGLARLLVEAGHEVIAEVGDADALVSAARADPPDLCIVDIRMPPLNRSDGAGAAKLLRSEQPGLPILFLSQHIELRHSLGLISSGACGYLLKDRVLGVGDFLDAVQRVAQGGSAVDPEVVAALVSPRLRDHALQALSPREIEVLEMAAEGHSNGAIAERLALSERTVETHMRSVFSKLGIAETGTTHRRVLAVLAYLSDGQSKTIL